MKTTFRSAHAEKGIIFCSYSETVREHPKKEKKWIDKSEVYETKYIDSVKSLTRYDKAKIIDVLRKK